MSSSQFIVHDKQILNELDCSDPLKFQNRILRIRKFDDTIINILNSEIPTESFLQKGIVNPSNKCNQFKQEIRDYYDSRENAVKKCIDFAKKEVDRIKQSSDIPVYLLREKSYNLRLYQQELEIEHIDRARTEKAVEERCRSYQ